MSKDLQNQEDKVMASEIGFHVVSIKPTKPVLLNETVLVERKFKVENLNMIEGEE